MSISEFKIKLTQLRINRASPHKICMLLAVLDLARSGLLTTNRIAYAPPLLERYMQYFNAVRTERNHPNPYFPYFHLTGDLQNSQSSFWKLIPLPGRESILSGMRTARRHRDITDNVSHAELDPDLFRLLQDPRALEELGDTLARHWFDRGLPELGSVVAQAKLISRYEHRLRDLIVPGASEPSPPEYIRNPAFRRVVLETYDYRCAATGLRLLINDTAMVEAAHLHPFSSSGDDDPRNGLALTPDMHWAMDAFLIAPGPDYKWHVTKQLDSRIPDHRIITELKGKPIFLPREPRMYPKKEALEWRVRQLD